MTLPYAITVVLTIALVGALTKTFFNMSERRVWLQLSLTLAWFQLGASTYIAIQSSHDAISKISCLGGFFGFWVTVALIIMDILGFSWVKFRQRKSADKHTKRNVTGFIALRVASHIMSALLFGAAVAVCTV